MSKKTDKKMQIRIVVIEVGLLLLIVLLGGTAFKIQVLEKNDLAGRAEHEYTGYDLIKGKRGDILDRNMNKLATTIDALSLACSPSKIKNSVMDAEKLAPILGINRRILAKKFNKRKKFLLLKKNISPDLKTRIDELGIKGLFFRNDVVRFYPNRNLAAQVIGFTGNDNTGLEGLEYRFDSVLKGRKIKISITRDGKGHNLGNDKILEQRFRGDSLVLTIDGTIQYICETALKKAVMDNDAKSGMAIVMRPSTGEILAMALFPEFNPNSFSGFKRGTWRNRTVTDPFEPGSVMKVFVASVAMDKGYCTPKSIFFCENGAYSLGRFVIHDTHSHGWLTLSQIVKYSSNIGAAKVSETIGRKTLYDSLLMFGFGRKTSVDCPGETTGLLIPYGRWSDIDEGAIAFGQGISVSALQLITGISAIADNGVLMKPLIVREIIANDGTIKKKYMPEPVVRVISTDTATRVRHMMRSVVEENGTGTEAAIDGYSVCGKTGTAQKAAKNGIGYAKKKYTAVFTGFAPEKNPQLAVLVVIDEPQKSHYGGVVAAPAFKKIMSEALNYFHIPPDLNSGKLVAENFNGVTP